jgi:uncharacterized protein
MRSYFRPARLLAPVVLFALAGCFKLSRDAPRLQQYVLSGAPQPSAVAATVTGDAAGNQTPGRRTGVTLGLRRMQLASYLSVPAIVIRRGVNELVVSEFHRWGEPLDAGINRAVAAHLASSSIVHAVDVAPWAPRARHDYLVQLHVSRFEGVAEATATEGGVHVLAGWDIIRPLDGAVLVRGTTDDRAGSWRVGDYAGLVTALDAALSRVAQDISVCLSRFPNDSTPPASCESVAGQGASGAR